MQYTLHIPQKKYVYIQYGAEVNKHIGARYFTWNSYHTTSSLLQSYVALTLMLLTDHTLTRWEKLGKCRLSQVPRCIKHQHL